MGKAIKNYAKFYSKETYAAVNAVIHKVERDYHLKAHFGRIAGSKSLGISTKSSDNDFHIYVEGSERNPEQRVGKLVQEIYLNDKLVKIHLVYFYWDTVLEQLLERKQLSFESYPTSFYRSEEEKLKYLPQNMPEYLQRDSLPVDEFCMALFSDSLWVPEAYTDYNFMNLWQLKRTIDAMDLSFAPAYGNYVHFMENQERILLRKYLNTLFHIWRIEWLLNKGTKPPTMFTDLMAGMEFRDPIRQSIDELIALNQEETLDKAKAQTERRPELIKYIEIMLDRQKERISRYPREETLADVISRTPRELRPKLYFEKYGDWMPLE